MDIYDVNRLDGVTALDALLIINELGRRRDSDADGLLPATRPDNTLPPFYDVSIDGHVTALDALLVINQLERIKVTQVVAEPEAELLATPLPGQRVITNSQDYKNDDEETQSLPVLARERLNDFVWATESFERSEVNRMPVELEVSESETTSDIEDRWKLLDRFFASSRVSESL